MEPIPSSPPSTSIVTPLIAGGIAGTFTDTILFPLDTVKTRLQSGASVSTFSNIYRGLGPAVLVSGPSAATFFAVYDWGKNNVFADSPLGHGQAAAVAEVAACFVKVPFEILKQRKQAESVAQKSIPAWTLGLSIWRAEGIRGVYAGLGATIAREIPFGFIQMPLYEWLKKQLVRDGKEALTNAEAGLCGAVAGGVAAFVTCPIDVWKTRLMLGDKNASVFSIGKNEGVKALFSGVVPRVLWISVGGSLFFGAYEFVRKNIC